MGPGGDRRTRAASLLILVTLLSVPPAFAQQVPPLKEHAQTAIDRSPRHGEWVEVAVPDGTSQKAWVMYPERSDKAPVVIVLHSTTTLDDWTRALADQLSGDGYIAIAPEFTRPPTAEIVPRLQAVRAYGATLPAANGRAAIVVFDGASPEIPSSLSLISWAPVFRIAADASGRSVQAAWGGLLTSLKQHFR